DASLLNQRANIGIGLRIGRTFAQDDERTHGALEQADRALNGVRGRNLTWRRIDDLDERSLPYVRVDRLREHLRRQVEVDASRAARDGGADGARDANSDVLDVQHTEGSLGERLGDRQLVHLFVVPLLQ